MKGLLLSPPLDIGFQIYPPLGLMNLYSTVESSYDIHFLNLSSAREKQIDEALRERYDFVGITCTYTTNANKTIEFAARIKERHPDTILIGGGNHATFVPDHLLKNGFDFIVRHEGEVTFPELLKCIDKNGGKAIEVEKGIAYIKDGHITVNEDRPFIQNLDDLPFPRLSILDPKIYRGFMGKKPTTIETSRGCIFRCKICSTVRMWGNTWRFKSPERVAEEFRYIAKVGVDEVYLADDNFAIDPDRGIEICESLISQGNRIPWIASMESSLIVRNPGILGYMKKAGCELVVFSVDSANEEIIRGYRKPHNLEMLKEALNAIKLSEMLVVVNVVFGYPGETVKQMDNSIRFARNYADILTVGILEPRPGCDFWDKAYEDRYDLICQGYSMLHARPNMIGWMQKFTLIIYYFSPINLFNAFIRWNTPKGRILRMHYFIYYKAFLRLIRTWFRLLTR